VVVLQEGFQGKPSRTVEAVLDGFPHSATCVGRTFSQGGRLGVVTIGSNLPPSHPSNPLNTLNIFASAEAILQRLVDDLSIAVPHQPRSLCCLHRAKALVPYDEHGRRCTGEKMWLNLQVIIIIIVIIIIMIVIIISSLSSSSK